MEKGEYLMQSVIDQVEQREEELIQLVSQLITFETPAPPARNTSDIQQFIARYVEELGLTVDQWEVHPNDPNLVATLKGRNSKQYSSLILNGHVDVAAIKPSEKWRYQPFEPTVSGRELFGRGAADMKGGLAACLFAIKLMKEAGVELNGDVILQSVVGEEVGEAGTKQCCERGYKADYAIVADTSNCEIHGQGGVITGWVTVKSPATHHDGTRRQMIHAGGGLRAASAIEKMTKLMTALQELERDWAVTKSYPGFPAGTNTINPAVIEGGRHPAFIADECRLWITVHYYPNETAEAVAEEIETHLLAVAQGDVWLRDHPPQFSWGGQSMIEDRGEVFPSFSVDEAHPAYALLNESHQAVLGKAPQTRMSETVTDGGCSPHMGFQRSVTDPGSLRHAHAVDERVNIDQLVQYTKTLLRFMMSWCNQPKQT
ncbi:LOW QUALITY PROTEIN: acetylornithine deacetylase [Bacillus sp. JCM 19045]|nr:LOW QUALITY PROTEIN: acetylornithine deacetylase [Bacillus sp. JCM 19045]